MPTSDEPSRPQGGTVYGAPVRARLRLRLPGDRMMLTALAVGVVGVLVGALFATGIFAGSGGRRTANVLPLTPTAGLSATPGGTAAGATSPAATPPPTEAATPSPTPAATGGASATALTFHSAISSLCLDVAAGEDPEGADALQAACTGGPSQQWLPTPAGTDAVGLVSSASGKCLDVDGESRDDGAAVQQWSCNGGANQQWRLTPSAAGPVTLVNVNSGLCLDLPGSSASPGTKLVQSACTGGTNQQWTP
jgi:hypothetical protein